MNIRNHAITEGIGNLNIPRRLLIHLISGIPVGKQVLFILNGDHIFFHHNGIIAPVIDLDVICPQINSENIVSQNRTPFM